VLVDGFSQRGYAGTPLIQVDGQSGAAPDGLTITGSGATIRGLDIANFVAGAGIVIDGSAASANVIKANVIGVDPSGVPSECPTALASASPTVPTTTPWAGWILPRGT
jgi:hypothetical protein